MKPSAEIRLPEDAVHELRRLSSNDAYRLLNKKFTEELERRTNRLFDSATTDAEAQKLRAAVIALRQCAPDQILQGLIRSAETRVSKQHPKLVK